MSGEKQLKELIESSEDILFQKLIDRQEGAEGQCESIALGPAPEAEMKKFQDRLSGRPELSKRQGHHRRKLGRSFVIAAVLIVLLFTVARASPGIMNWATESYEKFMQFRSGPSPKDVIAAWDDVYLPTYLPKDFQISDAVDSETVKIIEYSNTAGERILFYQYTTDDNLRLDIENAEQASIEGGKGTVYLIEKEDTVTLYWLISERLFSIEVPASVKQDEAVKIAESISPVSDTYEEEKP